MAGQEETTSTADASPGEEDGSSEKADTATQNKPAAEAVKSSEENTAERVQEEGDDKGMENHVDDQREQTPSKAEESTEEANERVRLERRRRRCPVIEIERYGSDGESKEEGEGKQRSPARMVMQEDIAGLRRLVREGASVSDADSHGWTRLHWACSRGSTAITHMVLQEIRASHEGGADEADEGTSEPFDCLNAAEGLNEWTALHLAVIGGHLDTVYLLMEAGADVNVKDRVGDRPVNCVKRAANQIGGLAARLRNALLDLLDAESSGPDSSTSTRQRGDEKYRANAPPRRPQNRRGAKRERHPRR